MSVSASIQRSSRSFVMPVMAMGSPQRSPLPKRLLFPDTPCHKLEEESTPLSSADNNGGRGEEEDLEGGMHYAGTEIDLDAIMASPILERRS